MSNRDDQEFTHESVHDTATITEYLSALVEALGAGQLKLQQGDAPPVLLAPKSPISLSLHARRKLGRAKLTLKLNWREDRAGADAPSLKIEVNDS
ncbi:MAG: amphi-Trp domain-containing protein [Myxococcales bacterium FL481]|nr:MAG: amphi-Trp domain-containing protein [Myxococcales bacterium FL481]